MRRRVEHPGRAALVLGLVAGVAWAPAAARADSTRSGADRASRADDREDAIDESGSRRGDVRPWSGSMGAGGYVALGGPATGLAAVATLSPGGWAGRLGLRVEARTAGETASDTASDGDRFDRGLFTAGLTYEAAASRPRLALSLHGELGALAPDPLPALGGGVDLELWLVGPIALAAGSSAHVIVDGLDTRIVLAGTLGLRLAR